MSQLISLTDQYTKFTAQLKLATTSTAEYANAYADVQRISKAAQSDSSSMNDREIAIAALRWHTARARRLVVGAQKRQADAVDGLQGLHLQVETSRRLTQAKRVEQAALRELAKSCEKQRARLGEAEDADLVVDL